MGVRGKVSEVVGVLAAALFDSRRLLLARERGSVSAPKVKQPIKVGTKGIWRCRQGTCMTAVL